MTALPARWRLERVETELAFLGNTLNSVSKSIYGPLFSLLILM